MMTENPKEPPTILEHVLKVGGVVAASFLGFALICGLVLLYWKKDTEPPTAPAGEVLKEFTDEEIRAEIHANLERFLKLQTTAERLGFVIDPKIERAALANYYEGRGNRDVPLEGINFIKPVTLDGRRLWIVSYLDVRNENHLLSFERRGNRFLLHWSASYVYGELPWDRFAERKPSEPVAMRAFLLRHEGQMPPGFDSDEYAPFVVEDDKGAFTGMALMKRDAEGFALLADAPEGSKLPVNIEIFYSKEPGGDRQLMIHRLIHFQWLGSPLRGKGKPFRREPEKETLDFRLVPD